MIVPTKYSDGSVIIEVDQHPSATLVGATKLLRGVRCHRVGVQNLGQLRLENIALRQQLTVLRRSAPKRLKLTPADRIFWVWLRLVWCDWKLALMIVKAETVIAWHRKGFRLFWTWKIHRGKPGRPQVPKDIRDLIRMMSRNNPRWGAPRIHAELLKLGIEITEPTVAKYTWCDIASHLHRPGGRFSTIM
jgi:hypothetical protein